MSFNPDELIKVESVRALSKEDQDKLRYKLQTDLFFLANNVLRNRGSKPLKRSVHGGICDNLVHKDPDKDILEWSDIKERVILSSRGTLKSTIEAADIVQIILCCPNVRIILMSGKLNNAKTILKMARGYFEGNEILQCLFPEFCEDIAVNAEEFTTPARRGVDYRDPTIQIATFGSVKAGAHAEYIKLDDCTNEINQATPELVEKTIQQYDDLDPLLEPGGYIDFTGTRWAVDDLPEYIRIKGEELEKETKQKHVIHFLQPVWTVREPEAHLHPLEQASVAAARNERARRNRLEEADVNLLWPEKLTWSFLHQMYRKNPRKFQCQYLLNPEAASGAAFTRALLTKQTKGLEFCPLPHQSSIFINWDLAGISGKGDFSVGVVGVWEQTGRLFIIDCIVERFTSSTAICNAILGLYKKYNPDYHRIEAANGSELIQGELASIAKRMNLQRAFRVSFDPPSNENDAKNARIRLLAGALEKDQLQFFDGIDPQYLEELYKQFEKFSGRGTYKDDGPDCVAQMWSKWKDMIGPKAVTFLTPADRYVEWDDTSACPDIIHGDGRKTDQPAPDSHADETMYADIDFLKRFTVPTS